MHHFIANLFSECSSERNIQTEEPHEKLDESAGLNTVDQVEISAECTTKNEFIVNAIDCNHHVHCQMSMSFIFSIK